MRCCVVVGVADDSSDASVAIYRRHRGMLGEHFLFGCHPQGHRRAAANLLTSSMFQRQREEKKRSFFSNRIREFSIRLCIRERAKTTVWKSRLTLHHHHLCRDMTRHLTHSHFNLSFFPTSSYDLRRVTLEASRRKEAKKAEAGLVRERG